MNDGHERQRAAAHSAPDDPAPLLGTMALELERLDGHLAAEARALAAVDADALQAAVEDKRRSLAELHRCAAQLGRLLEAAGLPADAPGLQQLLGPRDNGADLVARWERVRAALERCRNANEANGGAMARARRGTELALESLRGKPLDPPAYVAPGARPDSPDDPRVFTAWA